MQTRIFSIWGEDRIELEAFSTLSEAAAWLDGYTRRGDWGGYTYITIRDSGRDGGIILSRDRE